MFVASNELKALLPYFRRKLAGIYPDREIESMFFLVCFHRFGLSRSSVLHGDNRLTESELLDVRQMVHRLADQEPLQYILGKADFFDLVFEVGTGVLIPRPETEELVDRVLRDPATGKAPLILDVGTGSGCIAITLAKHLPGASVFALDHSSVALGIAAKNAAFHDVDVAFLETDILRDSLPELPALDVIVSNPPYIPNSDRSEMSRNVLGFEPEMALFVHDDDPLLFYRLIGRLALEKLKPGGKLWFEIHRNFGPAIGDLLDELGFGSVRIHKDLGGADRFAEATK